MLTLPAQNLLLNKQDFGQGKRRKKISLVAFRKKHYESVKELQVDLDNFIDYYNYRRTHQGYKLKKNGYRIPAEAHLKEMLDITKGKW